jgi:PAS domain S-box-containing protein
MVNIVWFVVVFFCLRAVGVAVAAAPADDYLSFRRLTPEVGLPTEQVLRIFEDSRGFLWFGTSDGLARYDSHEFRVFRPDPKDPHSLGNGNVADIQEDAQGNLWIATLGGLDLWHRDTEQFSHFRHDPANTTSLSDDGIRSLLLDQDGSLWVGTAGAGLNHFDPRSGRCERFMPEPSRSDSLSAASIYCLFRDRKGQIWIGTGNGGLNWFDPHTGRFRVYAHDPGDPRSLSHNHVSAIDEDAEGYLWVGTDEGISRLDPERRFFERLTANVDDSGALQSRIVDAVMVDREGRVWVGTDGGGLSRFDAATRKFIHYRHSKYAGHTLASDVVRTIFQDRVGDYWIGHFPAGVSHADRLAAPFQVFRSLPGETNTLSDEHVMSFLEDPSGDLWVGTDNGGLNHWHQATGRWTSYRHDPHDPRSLGAKSALTLLRDYRGQLWVGTWGGGLDRFEPDTGTFRHYLPDPARSNSLGNPQVWRLLEDRQHQLWVATSGGGLDRYLPDEDAFIHYRHDPANPRSLNSDYVSSLLLTRDGTLWVGTTEGLARWVPPTQSWDRFQSQLGESGTLSSKDIIDLIEDRERMIWVSTGGGGLNRLDPHTARFDNFRTADGLPSDVLRGILEDDDGMLWIASNQGLARFDPRTHKIRIFDENDGLPGGQFSPNARLRLRSGELVFGTTRGFVKFDPRALQKNTHSPPVVLTGFEVFNQPMLPGLPGSPLRQSITETRRLEIPARLSVLSFQFAALNYRSSAHNQYRFMLEGFDEDWRKPGPERRATYTNLDPGRYWLRVKAANSDGVWNETGVNLEVIVVPPWWRTWWFRAAAALAVWGGAATMGGAISARRSRARLREAERERQVAQERERAGEALRQSEAALRSVFKAAPIGICIMKDRVFQSANDRWYEIVGHTEAELLGQTPRQVYASEEEYQRVGRELYADLPKRGLISVETRLRRGDGALRDVILTAAPLNPHDPSAGDVVAISDVTERKQTEEARRESERKYQELVQHANSIILHWKRDGRIIFLNEFGQRFFGYTQAEICGRHVIGTIVPETESGGRDLHTLMDEVCANPAAFEQNVNENMRRNGERVWIAWTNKVVLDQQGKVAEILSIGVDITARKRVEEELRATQASLEQRVIERTAELAVARDRAEAADRTKSTFLATMSHELRTPLNSIIGFTGLLLQGLAGPLNAEQTKQLRMVKDSGQHLLALINDVLDISKIEAGQIEIANAPFDLPESIQKVVQTVAPLANKKQLPLITRIWPEVNWITSDRRRVEQILLNLLSNAIKFTEQGEVTLTAEIVPGTRHIPHSALRISVADTGLGIKRENLDKLFQPFRQLDTGLTRQHEGTGLGLAICKRLIERLGGTITVESEWGKGSTFQCTLPFHPERKS